MKFSASLDGLARKGTILVTLLFAMIILAEAYAWNYGESEYFSMAPVICLLAYGIALAYRPLYYQVDDVELEIVRPFSTVRIKRSDILKVEIAAESTLRGSIRTFGSGGFFGYYGKFYHPSLGAMTWYATRRDSLVFITTIHYKKMIFSPDDPELFVATLLN